MQCSSNIAFWLCFSVLACVILCLGCAGPLHVFECVRVRVCVRVCLSVCLKVEAHLWLAETMCVGVKPEEDSPVVLEVLKVVFSLQPDVHVALQSTALGVLSELARWLNMHPQYLSDVLTFVCNRAHIPGLGLSCMTTICDISEACQKNMLPHFDVLLQVSVPTWILYVEEQ